MRLGPEALAGALASDALCISGELAAFQAAARWLAAEPARRALAPCILRARALRLRRPRPARRVSVRGTPTPCLFRICICRGRVCAHAAASRPDAARCLSECAMRTALMRLAVMCRAPACGAGDGLHAAQGVRFPMMAAQQLCEVGEHPLASCSPCIQVWGPIGL